MAQGELRVVSVVVMTKADERLMKVKEALLCERRTRAKHLQGKTFRAGGRRKISKRIHPFALHQVAYLCTGQSYSLTVTNGVQVSQRNI